MEFIGAYIEPYMMITKEEKCDSDDGDGGDGKDNIALALALTNPYAARQVFIFAYK